jgi:flagellin
MVSINTNLAALTALQTLTETQQQLTKTQNEISSGYRVASAADNAAYWSIATTMRSDDQAISAVSDALGLGSSTVGVAATGMTNAVDVVEQIKAKLVAALQPGVDHTSIQSDISQLQQQLTSIASSASFSGVNWLSVDSSQPGYSPTASIVSSFSRTGSGVSVGTISINTASVALFDSNGNAGILDSQTAGVSVENMNISALTSSPADTATLNGYVSQVDAALSQMTAAATTLGSATSRITSQQTFVKSLMTSLESGVSTLVDADMNEESTQLQALQVKQQLGVQALSIANASSQAILQLFRG